LKRINKTPNTPDGLKAFAIDNPEGTWAQFKGNTEEEAQAYQALWPQIFDQQGWLCGYCETQIDRTKPKEKSIEHFHDKSDHSGIHNWDLDWFNLFGVCRGGEHADKIQYPRPANLSCDAHKNHKKDELTENPQGLILNPLSLPNQPCLFSFEPATGELKAHQENCAKATIADNQYDSVSALVEKTIYFLNLNCKRLKDERKKVFAEYQRLMTNARQRNNTEIKQQLAEQWFDQKIKSFYTTRRILVEPLGEQWISST
jgi:uncharacterized protein (TIGR02646 family)